MTFTFKITLFILLSGTFRECFFNASEPEYSIKRKIADFGNEQLPVSRVTLNKNNKYYIGYRDGDRTSYYLAFTLFNKDTFQVCQVISKKEWDKDSRVNKLIIKAANSLDSSYIKLDSVYDEGDSVRIILVNAKTYEIYPSVAVKNINDIINLNKLYQ